MLRCGCSNETILRNVSVRHFAGKVDPAGEKNLRAAHASPALIDAMLLEMRIADAMSDSVCFP